MKQYAIDTDGLEIVESDDDDEFVPHPVEKGKRKLVVSDSEGDVTDEAMYSKHKPSVS